MSLAVSLPTIAMLPPWGDEAITLRAIARPTAELIPERLGEAHSPVYFLLLRFLKVSDRSLFWLRLPSALGVAFGAACMARIAYRLGGERAGGWRAALLLMPLYACSPVIVIEAQNARPYGLLYGFLGLLAWSASQVLDHPRQARDAWRRRSRRAAARLRVAWAGVGLGALGLVAMMPLGLLAVLASDCALLWCARRRPGRRLLRPWFCLRAVTLALLTPLFYGLHAGISRRAGNYWPPEFGWDSLRDVLTKASGATLSYRDPQYFLGEDGGRVLFWALCLCMVLGLAWARRRRSLVLVIALAVVPQLLLLLVSLHTSVLVGRYFTIATPALVVLTALGLAGLWQRRRRIALIVAAPTLVLLLLQSLDAMHQLGKPRFDLAVARLRDAGIERLGFYARSHVLANSVAFHLDKDSRGLRLRRPWQAVLAAESGLLVWILDARVPIHPVWSFFAGRRGLGHCDLQVDGLHSLAIARIPEALAASCPQGSD
jgi:4-amino-4-deoxy-L-arabinose transferase-like glycosyltransferase